MTGKGEKETKEPRFNCSLCGRPTDNVSRGGPMPHPCDECIKVLEAYSRFKAAARDTWKQVNGADLSELKARLKVRLSDNDMNKEIVLGIVEDLEDLLIKVGEINRKLLSMESRENDEEEPS